MEKQMTIGSPIGPLTLYGTNEAIAELRFGGDADRRDDASGEQSSPLLERARLQLAEYFAGKRREFDLPLAPKGTAFQTAVWDALQVIPYGKTISYGELALRIGNPNASRAVGLANGRNPLPIFIPCHRVIGASGKLIGYGGGIERKVALLDLEMAVVAGRGPNG